MLEPVRDIDVASGRMDSNPEGTAFQMNDARHFSLCCVNDRKRLAFRTCDVDPASVGGDGDANGIAGDRQLCVNGHAVQIDDRDGIVILVCDEGLLGREGGGRDKSRAEDKASYEQAE